MKTEHVDTSGVGYEAIWREIRKHLQSHSQPHPFYRVVTHGKGVAIIPDSDRTKACSSAELAKIFGIPINKDAVHVESSRETLILHKAGSVSFSLNLTSDQVILLSWLQEEGFLDDEYSLLHPSDLVSVDLT